MRLGVSLTSVHVVDDHAEGARNIIERSRACAAAELDLLSMGDQHNVPVPYYQNVPMLGRLLAEWPIDRPVAALFLLPLWNPVTVAEQVSTLATISEVPFVIQTGIGGGEAAFAAMGKRLNRRAKDLDESIRIIKALLAGETVDSERFGLVGSRISPRPPVPAEWWIGAGAPAALDRAAREGDCWYGNADLTPETAKTALQGYHEACERHGRVPRAAVRKDVIVLDDADRARTLGDELIEAGYRGMPREAVAYGGVDDVADQLGVFKDLGFDDVTVRCMTIPQTDAVETLTLCGEVRAILA
jgi:alkanesulfonate monooxygenase SsuD/methylene tetrahydromethanopterin reductase-like flavin-dependent oxidoreductase (luciferase family)